MDSPQGIDLDQYRTQAKELLKAARSADPQAIERIRTHHPEHDSLLASGRLQLVDAQLTIARELGYGSWPKMKEHLLFLNAVQALDAGDLPGLEALLETNPRLLAYRCHIGDWYEQGYFAGAMLIHHIAGNPIRRPLPANIVDVAKLLLARGADPNGKTDPGWTTIGLILTGRQPSEAGVALPLIDLLISAGARDDLDQPDVLTGPLLNVAPETAEALVKRGAKIEARHAAGLGRLDLLEPLLAGGLESLELEEALCFACIRGQAEAARMLVRYGARGDVLVTPGGQTPRTALHEAANRGRIEIVQLLLDNGARADVIEPRWGGTAAGWAEHGGHPDIAERLRRRSSA